MNVYGRGADISFPFVDIVYGYRKTNVFGLGGVYLNDFFTFRYDIGYFKTRDQNSSIERTSTFNPSYYDSLHFSYPLKKNRPTYKLPCRLILIYHLVLILVHNIFLMILWTILQVVCLLIKK